MESNAETQITRGDLNHLTHPSDALITEVKALGSYSWIKSESPTIAVPGSPALWSPRRGIYAIKKDSGLVFISQDAACHPSSPLESLFRALYAVNPSFDIGAVDVLTDRNNIRKLLSFIDGGTGGKALEEFTIKVELAKDTAIFCRTEPVAKEYIGPRDFRGFGHEFERVNTTNQIPDATGHHQIVSYKFGGMRFIVRHETDGYTLPTNVENSESTASGSGTGSEPTEEAGLPASVATLNLSPPDEAQPESTQGSVLTLKKQGKAVPQSSLLEIKTRSVYKPLSIPDVAAQLWISQTPQLVRAYHIKGTFTEADVENVTTEIQAWEAGNQDVLRKLAALIKKICSAARSFGGEAVVEYDPQTARLSIRKRVDDKKFLPTDLYAKWT